MEYIDIDKTLIPYVFDIELGNEEFTFDVSYNENHDFFVVQVYKNTELVAVEKLVYGVPLFKNTYNPKLHPAPMLIPLDISAQSEAVNWETLGKNVFLYLADSLDDEVIAHV